MNSTNQYISACRTLLTLNTEDLSRQDDLVRLILKLRQSLQCRVCRSICRDPLSSESCQHLVCSGCLRTKVSSYAGCRWCRNTKDLKRDNQTKSLIECYGKMCELFMQSSLAATYRSQNGGRNRIWSVIQEASSRSQDRKGSTTDFITDGCTGELSDSFNRCDVDAESGAKNMIGNESLARFPDDNVPLLPAKIEVDELNEKSDEKAYDHNISTDRHGTIGETMDEHKDSHLVVSPGRRKSFNKLAVAPLKVKVSRINDETHYHLTSVNDENHGKTNNDTSKLHLGVFRDDQSIIREQNCIIGASGDVANCQGSDQTKINTVHIRKAPVRRKRKRGRPALNKKNVITANKIAFQVETKNISKLDSQSCSCGTSPSVKYFTEVCSNYRCPCFSKKLACSGCKCRFCSNPNKDNCTAEMQGDNAALDISNRHFNGRQESEEEVEILN